MNADPTATAVGLGFVAFALLVLAIRFLQVHLTPRARPAAAPPAATAGRCQAPLCAELATVNVSVIHGDVMPLCMGHGLPLLTEGLRS